MRAIESQRRRVTNRCVAFGSPAAAAPRDSLRSGGCVRRCDLLFDLVCLLDCFVDAEARGFLAWRELLEGLQELAHDFLSRNEQERAIHEPLVVVDARVFVGALERIAPQVVDLGHAHLDERLAPHADTVGPLLREGALPLPHAQRHEVAVVAPVEKSLAWVLLHFALHERQ